MPVLKVRGFRIRHTQEEIRDLPAPLALSLIAGTSIFVLARERELW